MKENGRRGKTKKIFLTGLLSVLLSFFVLATSANATTRIYDFDSGIDDDFTIINTGDVWTIDNDGPSLRISKSVDNGDVNGDDFIEGGIFSNFLLGGDFTATVDFHLFDFPATAEPGLYNEVIFRATDQNGRIFQIFRQSFYRRC